MIKYNNVKNKIDCQYLGNFFIVKSKLRIEDFHYD